MNRELLQWAKEKFTFVVDRHQDHLTLRFVEREGGCTLDFAVSYATNRKQLAYDMNQFMVALERIL